MIFALGFAVSLFAISFPAPAQKEPTKHRIGILNAGAPPSTQANIFIGALRQLGYSDEKLSIEDRFAHGKYQMLFQNGRGNWLS